MEININNPIFSVEFNKTTKYIDVDELNIKMQEFFYDKSYSNCVKEYFIGLICVSPGFDEFFKPKRPRYYEDKILKARGLPRPEDIHPKHRFSCELKLDYSIYYPSNKEEGYDIIAKFLLEFLEVLKYPSAIKTFDKKKFNEDMKTFFIQVGCSF